MDRTHEWCWHWWVPTLKVLQKDYISGRILYEYRCEMCDARKGVWV